MQFRSLLLALALAAPHVAAQGSAGPFHDADAEILRMERMLEDIRIQLDGMPKEIRFRDLLKALDKQIGKDKKVALRVDEKALGNELRQILEKEVRMPAVAQMSLPTVLQFALGQVNADLEWALRPNALLLTRRAAALYTRIYDVRDLLDVETDLIPGKTNAPSTPALLSALVELKPGESMHIVNGSRVVLRASHARQSILQDTIAVLRRLNEVQVYMNGRIYEVPNTFYAEHIASLFKRDGDKEPPAIVAVNTALAKKVTAHKLLLESDDVSIRPGESKGFLSWQETHAYAANPKAVILFEGVALSGVVFKVRPQVAADRRFLRLEIQQRVEEVLGIDKVKQLDRETGKEVLVEAPRMRRSSASGVVKIPDVGAVLAPIDFHPRTKESEGKVWVMLARPMIWLPDEIELLRQQGQIITPKSAWQLEPDTPDPPRVSPPLTLKAKELLQAVLTHALTASELKELRHLYGGEKDRNLALETGKALGNSLGWPKDFSPATHGYRLVTPDPFDGPDRFLEIRLDKFTENPDPKQKDAPIQITIAGGGPRDRTIGACIVRYRIAQQDGRWIASFESSLDP